MVIIHMQVDRCLRASLPCCIYIRESSCDDVRELARLTLTTIKSMDLQSPSCTGLSGFWAQPGYFFAIEGMTMNRDATCSASCAVLTPVGYTSHAIEQQESYSASWRAGLIPSHGVPYFSIDLCKQELRTLLMQERTTIIDRDAEPQEPLFNPDVQHRCDGGCDREQGCCQVCCFCHSCVVAFTCSSSSTPREMDVALPLDGD